MWQKLKILKKFLDKKYFRQVDIGLNKISKQELHQLNQFATQYFKRFGSIHRHSYHEFKNAIPSHYPAQVEEVELSQDLLGVFCPHPDPLQKGKILLNKNHSPGMFLTTLAHENGHVLAHHFRIQQNDNNPSSTANRHYTYTRAEELWKDLQDDEECLADLLAVLGGYPQESFIKTFCNSQKKIKWFYQRFPLALILRANFYIKKYYPEVFFNFFKARHKFYHYCLFVHFIRLRVLAYQRYDI